MNRRSFITGLASALAAPAIVRPESLMKLWVPTRRLITRGVSYDVGPDFDSVVYWMRLGDQVIIQGTISGRPVAGPVGRLLMMSLPKASEIGA